LDGVNGILMQQEPNSPKQDYWNRRAIASLANTLITVMIKVFWTNIITEAKKSTTARISSQSLTAYLTTSKI
jgi:hypothetical protein